MFLYHYALLRVFRGITGLFLPTYLAFPARTVLLSTRPLPLQFSPHHFSAGLSNVEPLGRFDVCLKAQMKPTLAFGISFLVEFKIIPCGYFLVYSFFSHLAVRSPEQTLVLQPSVATPFISPGTPAPPNVFMYLLVYCSYQTYPLSSGYSMLFPMIEDSKCQQRELKTLSITHYTRMSRTPAHINRQR